MILKSVFYHSKQRIEIFRVIYVFKKLVYRYVYKIDQFHDIKQIGNASYYFTQEKIQKRNDTKN